MTKMITFSADVRLQGMFLYYLLMIDLAVFNNKLSVQVLVCGRMVQEVLVYLVAILSIIMMSGSG